MAASKGTATITPFRNAAEGRTERTASRTRPKAPRPGAACRRPLATQSETI
jgi:hypothetical protein